MITFYEDCVATYDYRNGVKENHHYCYQVKVDKVTDTTIELSMITILTDSSVKYYYGSSDIEAYFAGHDPYWYGQCGSCGGTGKS